jgi:phage terminase large subunit-like protein
MRAALRARTKPIAGQQMNPQAPEGARPVVIRHIRDLIALRPMERLRRLARLTQGECDELLFSWRAWARDDQLPPPGEWVTWRLILAGRGAGKTRTGAETVRQWAQKYSPVNLIGATAADVRDVMVLGESGVLACCRRAERPTYARSARRLTWPNGSMTLLFSAEEPDRLRGEQHMKLWCDELAAWRYPETFDQALLGLRVGDRPQVVVTTTPRPIKIIRDLVADRDAVVTRGVTFDNRDFLARAFIKRIAERYAGRRLGQQEIFAEILEETPGALWTRELIERWRVPGASAPREFREIVVAVDPPAISGARADECGVIVAARAENGDVYVLADLSSQGDTPAGWSQRVAAAYRRYRANRVVAESNNGGEMVADVLRQCDANLPVRLVTATRGKYLRAEPVAAAYERGLVHHVGAFAKLEDQLCALTPDFDARSAGYSPDRADALVWAIADLIGGGGSAGMVEFYREAARKR